MFNNRYLFWYTLTIISATVAAILQIFRIAGIDNTAMILLTVLFMALTVFTTWRCFVYKRKNYKAWLKERDSVHGKERRTVTVSGKDKSSDANGRDDG